MIREPFLAKCVRCGDIHGTSDVEIAKDCRAVKKVTYQGYIYGANNVTVSYPGITSIEYIDLDQQQTLLSMNWDVQEIETTK